MGELLDAMRRLAPNAVWCYDQGDTTGAACGTGQVIKVPGFGERRSYDCSGFIGAALAELGYKLSDLYTGTGYGRVNTSILLDKLPKITNRDPQEDDIIIFDSQNGDRHSGVVLWYDAASGKGEFYSARPLGLGLGETWGPTPFGPNAQRVFGRGRGFSLHGLPNTAPTSPQAPVEEPTIPEGPWKVPIPTFTPNQLRMHDSAVPGPRSGLLSESVPLAVGGEDAPMLNGPEGLIQIGAHDDVLLNASLDSESDDVRVVLIRTLAEEWRTRDLSASAPQAADMTGAPGDGAFGPSVTPAGSREALSAGGSQPGEYIPDEVVQKFSRASMPLRRPSRSSRTRSYRSTSTCQTLAPQPQAKLRGIENGRHHRRSIFSVRLALGNPIRGESCSVAEDGNRRDNRHVPGRVTVRVDHS